MVGCDNHLIKTYNLRGSSDSEPIELPVQQYKVSRLKCNKKQEGVIVFLDDEDELVTADVFNPDIDSREIETVEKVVDFDFSSNNNYLAVVT